MDLHEILRAWASPLIAAVAFGYTYVTGRGKAAKEEQGKLEGRIAAVELGQATALARITQVELSVKHLPTREQFHAIELNFATMTGDMKVITAGMERVEKLLEKERPAHGA